MYLYSCENFIAHPFLWVLWEMFHRKKFLKMDFGAFFVVYFLYYFALKMFIAYL